MPLEVSGENSPTRQLCNEAVEHETAATEGETCELQEGPQRPADFTFTRSNQEVHPEQSDVAPVLSIVPACDG